jgi:hypothetical protein
MKIKHPMKYIMFLGYLKGSKEPVWLKRDNQGNISEA